MSWIRRHPREVDVALAAVVLLALLLGSRWDDRAHEIDALGALAALGTALPLVWRRDRPLAVLVAVIVGIVACNLTLKPIETIALPALLAVYTVARLGARRRSFWVGVALVPVVVGIIVAFSPHSILEVESLVNVLYVLLALVLGDAVRSRKSFEDAMRERAEQAERTREEEAERRVADERLRIARELHDVVAHAIVAINVQAGVAAHLVERRPEQAHGALREIKRVSGEALDDLRSTLGVLRAGDAGADPAPTRPGHGLDEVGELVERARAAGLEVELAVRRNGQRIPAPVEAAGYRIVQEALTNTVRHARATHAGVRVEVGADAVDIEVVDDGLGADAPGSPDGAGHGTRGIVERAQAVGGHAQSAAAPGGGWRVHASLPLAPDRSLPH